MKELGSDNWYTVKSSAKENPRRRVRLISPEREAAAKAGRSGPRFGVFGLVTAGVLVLGLGAVIAGGGSRLPPENQAGVPAVIETVPAKAPGESQGVLESAETIGAPDRIAAQIALGPPADAIHQAVRGDRAEEPATRGAPRTLRMLATAYTLECGNGDGYTAIMTRPRIGIIAVDPRVIPYGYLVYIEGYGYFRAEDTGGDIKGDRIDIFMLSREDALSFGRRWVEVRLIGKIEE